MSDRLVMSVFAAVMALAVLGYVSTLPISKVTQSITKNLTIAE